MKDPAVLVEISAEETEMLYRALNALIDTNDRDFGCEEYEMLSDLADRANKAFEDNNLNTKQ